MVTINTPHIKKMCQNLFVWLIFVCWMHYMVLIVYRDSPFVISWFCFHNPKRKPHSSRAGCATADGLISLLKGIQQLNSLWRLSVLFNSCIAESGNSPKNAGPLYALHGVSHKVVRSSLQNKGCSLFKLASPKRNHWLTIKLNSFIGHIVFIG